MAAKVTWYRDAWWVRTRWAGNRKKDRRIGPSKADKRAAEEIAKQINAALALGQFDPDRDRVVPCDAELQLIAAIAATSPRRLHPLTLVTFRRGDCASAK